MEITNGMIGRIVTDRRCYRRGTAHPRQATRVQEARQTGPKSLHEVDRGDEPFIGLIRQNLLGDPTDFIGLKSENDGSFMTDALITLTGRFVSVSLAVHFFRSASFLLSVTDLPASVCRTQRPQ